MPFVHSANTVLSTYKNRPCSRIGDTALNKNKGPLCWDQHLSQWVGHGQWVGKGMRAHVSFQGQADLGCEQRGLPRAITHLGGSLAPAVGLCPSWHPPGRHPVPPASFTCGTQDSLLSPLSQSLLCCLQLHFLSDFIPSKTGMQSAHADTSFLCSQREKCSVVQPYTQEQFTRPRSSQGPSLVLFDLSWLF